MSRTKISVTKIGGSLLSSADLPQRLRAWLEVERSAQSDAHFVLVVGGGALADVIRKLDSINQLGDEKAHGIAIQLMDVTAQIVAAMLPDLCISDDFSELRQRTEDPGVTLFSPSRFMSEIEPNHRGVRLPASWAVTSDSIAARLAIVLPADELVLAKSSRPPMPETPSVAISRWSQAGYVDRFMPQLAAEMPALRIVVP